MHQIVLASAEKMTELFGVFAALDVVEELAVDEGV